MKCSCCGKRKKLNEAFERIEEKVCVCVECSQLLYKLRDASKIGEAETVQQIREMILAKMNENTTKDFYIWFEVFEEDNGVNVECANDNPTTDSNADSKPKVAYMKTTIVRDDISRMETDAIVLPANPKLKEGSGTSKAIFEKAGRQELKDACKSLTNKYGDIRVGYAMPTLGFGCVAKYIIHTVVPKWIDGNSNEYEDLCRAYLSSLKLADSMGCSSMAIPLLASGGNGFDMDLALKIALNCIREYEAKNKLSEVYLTIYGHRITSLVKAKGLEVEERIDSSYELTKNEHAKRTHEKVSEEAKKLANMYIFEELKKGLRYIENQQTADLVHREVEMMITKIVEKSRSSQSSEDKKQNRVE